MRKRKTLLITALAVLLSVAGSCTNDSLDDGSSPDVIMEVLLLDNPPVTASLGTGGLGCAFTVNDWTFDVANEPKNTLATAPFNDIELISVNIVYDWIDDGLDAIQTNPRFVGLGGTIVPAQSSSPVSFAPIAFDDLTIGHSGRTGNLTFTFSAVTVEGTNITKTVFRQLFVEGCG